MKTITPDLRLAVDADNYMSETPIWHPEKEVLYWVNCEKPAELHFWDPRSGERRKWDMPERIGGFALKKSGGALIVLYSGLFDLDFESGELTRRLQSPLPDHIAMHESMCDRQGRLWVGSFNQRVTKIDDLPPGGGHLFRLDGYDNLVPVLDDVSTSNGLAFSPDGRTMFHTDAITRTVDAYDLDPASGSVSNKRRIISLRPDEGIVDGATVDSEGGYWAAIVLGGVIRRYLPDGTLDIEYKLPFSNPTKVSFGGLDLATLFITTTRMEVDGMEWEGAEMQGGLFAFEPGFRGVPENLLNE